jgi:hypothetical protein
MISNKEGSSFSIMWDGLDCSIISICSIVNRYSPFATCWHQTQIFEHIPSDLLCGVLQKSIPDSMWIPLSFWRPGHSGLTRAYPSTCIFCSPPFSLLRFISHGRKLSPINPGTRKIVGVTCLVGILASNWWGMCSLPGVCQYTTNSVYHVDLRNLILHHHLCFL